MSLLFTDGFDLQDYTLKWPTSSTFGFVTGRYGVGYACQVQNNFKRSYTAVSGKVFVGFAWRWPSANTGTIATIYGDSAATAHLTLDWTSSTLTIKRGGTIILTCSSSAVHTAIAAGQWVYIEISAQIHDTTGTAELKVNGNSVGTFSGDTKNAGTNNSSDAFGFSSNVGYMDDVYICNDQGTDNNTFRCAANGDLRVYTSVPSGAGASTSWTPDTGSNYARVAEIPYSASNYVLTSTGVAGTRDSYAMGDLPSSATTVYGVVANVIAKKSDAGTANIKPAVRLSSTNYDGSTIALTASDLTYQNIWETSPATSAAWTTSEVNGVEAGVVTA